MNLNTIVDVKRPKSFEEIEWRDGHAFLGGGTWLFSEPQVSTDTLVDLEQFGWPPLTVTPSGLEIAATCKIVELHDFKGPPEWRAVPLFDKCVDCFLMSFKIWNAATVGGNIVMSLPAGAMISLTAALEGVCTLWPQNGKPREVPVVDFVTGMHTNVLQKGELLRQIFLPAAALTKRFAMRQVSLTHFGRSAALIVATVEDNDYDFLLTISAATPRPVQIRFRKTPSAKELHQAIDERLPPDAWFNDVHGSAAYKRHVTLYLAEQIRAELS
ncbi:MAG: FAD binding domain-containing protein [Reyranella sp.]|nr:FAD binding domain-containing protein [Reyranella sp.]